MVWEGDNPSESAHITYRKLHHNVRRLANVLKSRGVEKGDRVCIYMPMIPEAAYAMLACARIGAVHSVVFGGFSPDSAARPHPRCRLPHRDHRRRGRARRQVHPAEAECGKGTEGLPGRLYRGGGRAHLGRHTLGRRPRHLCTTRRSTRPQPTARRKRWTPRTRCSSSIPPAAPASRRACCTPPGATCPARR
ncbi:AMP-binding protein [Pseudomonas aeruginosa]